MAVTATFVSATGNRATWLLAQDGGAGTTLTMTNAVILAALSTAARGNVWKTFNTSFVTDGVSVQSAMRKVIGGGKVQLQINKRTAAASGGATEDGGWAADVDTDAVSTTKPEININAGVLAADAYLVVWYDHSSVA